MAKHNKALGDLMGALARRRTKPLNVKETNAEMNRLGWKSIKPKDLPHSFFRSYHAGWKKGKLMILKQYITKTATFHLHGKEGYDSRWYHSTPLSAVKFAEGEAR